METIVPEARGRAEALRTYLAGGGALTRSGRYTKGRLKGKTLAEAQVEFDGRWAGASGAIKDKYANMAGKGAMSPSELADYESRVAGVKRTPKDDGHGQDWRNAQRVKRAGLIDAAKAKGDQATVDRLTEQGALHDQYDKFRGAGLGDKEAMKEAQGIRGVVKSPPVNKDLPLDERNPNHGPAAREKAPDPTMIGSPEDQARVDAEFNRTSGLRTADNSGSVSNAAVSAAMTPMQQAAATRAAQKPYNFNETAVGKAVSQITNPETVYNQKPVGTPVTGDPNKDLPLDERMKMQGKVNAPRPVVPAPAPIPVQAPPATPQDPQPAVAGVAPSPPKQFDGSPLMSEAAAKQGGVNRVTGLPFGYRPGMEVNPVLKPFADASVARQNAAQAAAPKPLIPAIAKPAPTPGGPSLEEGWARDRRNEANKAAQDKRIAANGNMGLKAGPVRPLAELADPRALKPLAKPAPRVVGSKMSFARRA